MTNTLLKKVISSLVDQLYQIECADEGQVNEDFAVNLMEVTSAELQSLTSGDLLEFLDVIAELAESEADEQRREYLEGLAENLGLDQCTA